MSCLISDAGLVGTWIHNAGSQQELLSLNPGNRHQVLESEGVIGKTCGHKQEPRYEDSWQGYDLDNPKLDVGNDLKKRAFPRRAGSHNLMRISLKILSRLCLMYVDACQAWLQSVVQIHFFSRINRPNEAKFLFPRGRNLSFFPAEN